ncbi:MAG: Na+/H+ antiporter NhaA [Acidobacteria bacterium]|nr:Na+/H+ antiporter NhaA [Acidobacteriota bacterium]
MYLGRPSISHSVNDAPTMAFFLFTGLERERELDNGELSNFRNALLAIFATVGGIRLPALSH